MNGDDQLRRDLQSRIPEPKASYWDSIDKRLAAIERAQELEPAVDTDGDVIRLTTMESHDDGHGEGSGHRGRYLMAVAVLVAVLALGAVVFTDRSSTTTAGELGVVTEPETAGDDDDAPEDVEEQRLPASKGCYGDDVTVMVLTFSENAETFVGGIRTTIDGLVNHVGVSGVRFDGTLFRVQSRRVGGDGTDLQEWGAFPDGMSTPYGLLAPVICTDRLAEVEKIDAAVTRYPALPQN